MLSYLYNAVVSVPRGLASRNDGSGILIDKLHHWVACPYLTREAAIGYKKAPSNLRFAASFRSKWQAFGELQVDDIICGMYTSAKNIE